MNISCVYVVYRISFHYTIVNFDTERPSGSKEHANAPSALACSLLLRDTDKEDRQLVQAGHSNAEDDRAVDVGPWCEKRCSNPHANVSSCTFLF